MFGSSTSRRRGSNTNSTTDDERLTYVPAGKVASRRVRDGHALAFGYDAFGRMTSETGPLGAVTSSYDAAGRRTRLVHAGGAVNHAHDVLGRVTSVYEDHAGGANSNHLIARFWYNDRGRINTVVRGADGGGSNTTYYYDAASRVSVMANDAPGEANDFPVRFGYNPAGQIRSREMWNDAFSFTAHSNGSVGASVNGLNQLTSDGGTAIQHDGRGNVSSDGSTAYAYDAENRMVTASGARNASLGYDPLGRLYQVTGSGGTTRFVYDGMNMVAEYDGAGQLQRRHVQGEGVDEHLATYEGSSVGIASRRYPHQDERGSVVALLNADGSLNAVNRYDLRPAAERQRRPVPVHRPDVAAGGRAPSLPRPHVRRPHRPVHAARPDRIRRWDEPLRICRRGPGEPGRFERDVSVVGQVSCGVEHQVGRLRPLGAAANLLDG